MEIRRYTSSINNKYRKKELKKKGRAEEETSKKQEFFFENAIDKITKQPSYVLYKTIIIEIQNPSTAD